ncbi:MAG: TRAP transporter substrate-binding protein [Deltaproteobacteria bacterium]|nr:TRAP transporter substrate-binding protein [Deltaproteobacteria bacterium]MBW2128961.1 TRAP transporter substrate-binding protein [Deltaproteobacteria bacterium]MBW2302757.1 TRAP transporter substrate-binding protein [Deltaproteobacteria bacterium]
MCRLTKALISTGLFVMLALCPVIPGIAGEAQFTARYATQLSKTFHLTETDYKFAELVAQKTDGRLKIDVYPAGQLYKGRSIVKAIVDGALQIGIVYSGAWNGQLPYIDIFDVPFVFKSMEDIHQAIAGPLGGMIARDMEKFNARLLYVGYYGRSFEIANRIRPLKTRGDFKGLKIRCNLPTAVAAISAMGAAPVKMSSSEVYMALQRKTIDGVVSGAQSIVKRKWNETCKFLTITNGSYSPWPVVMNLKFWNKLPADIQKAVMEAAAEVSRMSLNRAEKEDAAALAQAKKSMDVHLLQGLWPEARDAGLAAWRKRTGDQKADDILKLLGL